MDSLLHAREHNIRTNSLVRIEPNCCQKIGTLLRRTVGFADGLLVDASPPRHVQECIEEFGLTGGKAPSTLGTKDTVKNLAEAEDGFVGSGVEELPKVGRQDARSRWPW